MRRVSCAADVVSGYAMRRVSVLCGGGRDASRLYGNHFTVGDAMHGVSTGG